jgi:hypothetical protein
MRAAAAGEVAEINALVEAGADPSYQEDTEGVSPLMRAAEHGHLDAVVALMEGGAPWNAQDTEGYTAGGWGRGRGKCAVPSTSCSACCLGAGPGASSAAPAACPARRVRHRGQAPGHHRADNAVGRAVGADPGRHDQVGGWRGRGVVPVPATCCCGGDGGGGLWQATARAFLCQPAQPPPPPPLLCLCLPPGRMRLQRRRRRMHARRQASVGSAAGASNSDYLQQKLVYTEGGDKLLDADGAGLGPAAEFTACCRRVLSSGMASVAHTRCSCRRCQLPPLPGAACSQPLRRAPAHRLDGGGSPGSCMAALLPACLAALPKAPPARQLRRCSRQVRR